MESGVVDNGQQLHIVQARFSPARPCCSWCPRAVSWPKRSRLFKRHELCDDLQIFSRRKALLALLDGVIYEYFHGGKQRKFVTLLSVRGGKMNEFESASPIDTS